MSSINEDQNVEKSIAESSISISNLDEKSLQMSEPDLPVRESESSVDNLNCQENTNNKPTIENDKINTSSNNQQQKINIVQKIRIDNNGIIHPETEISKIPSEKLPNSQNNPAELQNNIPLIINKIGNLDVSNRNDETVHVSNVNKENESLKNILLYSSDSDDDYNNYDDLGLTLLEDDNETASSQVQEKTASDIDSDDDDMFLRNNDKRNRRNTNQKPNRSGYDIGDYLPEEMENNFKIDYLMEEFVHLGNIDSIVGDIVTVAALDRMPSLDLDTPLFVNHRGHNKKRLGFIFDVLGNILKPFYCIRFRHLTELLELELQEGQSVYYAPKINQTKQVPVGELIKMKGSDASWVNDVEVPEGYEDYSDDEKERESIRQKKSNKRTEPPSESPSLVKYQKYEKEMNQCNILKTQAANIIGSSSTIPTIPGWSPTFRIEHMQPMRAPLVPNLNPIENGSGNVAFPQPTFGLPPHFSKIGIPQNFQSPISTQFGNSSTPSWFARNYTTPCMSQQSHLMSNRFGWIIPPNSDNDPNQLNRNRQDVNTHQTTVKKRNS